MSANPQPRSVDLILIGNPNVGKSVLFNELTGRYATVANYPGTTVEIMTATAAIGVEMRRVIDTPGVNTLTPQSEDERVTRDIVLSSQDAHVVQVGDLKNLRRTLLLTLELAEHDIPFTLALNMADEARELAMEIDLNRLGDILGIGVVTISALRGWNLARLRRTMLEPRRATFVHAYPAAIEEGVARALHVAPKGTTRGTALSILSGDLDDSSPVPPEVLADLDAIRRETEEKLGEPLAYAIRRDRVSAADRLAEDVTRSEASAGTGFKEWLGRATMHPVWGFPFLAVILAVAWWFVGNFGAGTAVDFVETQIFNRFVNPWTIGLLDAVASFPHRHAIEEGILTASYTLTGPLTTMGVVARFLHDLFAGPYGIVTMAITYAIAIVLPVVTTFFLFFGLLEDSGYLPRLAVMLNRLFRRMGLNGKAVLPMVLGLGCDTMATLTTRILETRKERLLVMILLALGVPCSAQLGVIVAMLGPLPASATFIWLSALVISIFAVGYTAARLLPGDSGDFLLEIPPIRVPRLRNIAVKVVARTEWYLKEAVPLFIVGTLFLYLLDVANLLVTIQRWIAPLVVGVLHLPQEAANAFLVGFLRRDYGAAGLFMMQRAGELSPIQTVVSLTVVTLFIPCVANFLMIVKERGMRTAINVALFILVYAFAAGWALDRLLRAFPLGLGS